LHTAGSRAPFSRNDADIVLRVALHLITSSLLVARAAPTHRHTVMLLG
jgi:hypothetical protein